MDKKWLLIDGQRKRFLEMESPHGEDAVKIVDLTTKNLEDYINLVDKAGTAYERIDSNFERRPPVGKMPTNHPTLKRNLS